MTHMLIAQGITIVIMIIGFVANIMYFRGVFITKLDIHEKAIDDLKDTVRFADTCDAKFSDHEKRIECLESTK